MTTGRLAQLWLERLLDIQEVTCSSQVSPTRFRARNLSAGTRGPTPEASGFAGVRFNVNHTPDSFVQPC
jgi:hypothetical protein